MNKKLVKPDPAPVETINSTRVEKKRVEEHVAIGAHFVYETIRR